MGAVLATLATLVILVLGGAFAVPYLVDWNDYRDVFETQASRLIGRKVDVLGNVSLTILPVPQIAFQNVRIADEAGNFDAALAQVQSFDMMLSLPALLTGAVEASSISLVKPVLRLSIDKSGYGNWRDLGLRDPGQIAPRQVTLNGVSIKDGVLEIAELESGALWRATSVTGSFAAESLQGPFKFNGAVSLGDGKHDVRFSTGKSAAGQLSLKATSQSAGGAQYGFDGVVSGLDRNPQYSGAASLKSANSVIPGWEAKAQASLSLAAVELTDLVMTVADDIRPQTLTGAASLTRGSQPRFDLELAGDWLNLDPLIPPSANRPLPETLNAGLRSLREAIDGMGEGRARLAVTQISARGEDLRNVSVDLAHNASGLEITGFRALAPGDSDIRLSGRMAATADAGFDGEGEVTGSNLSRFVKWMSGVKDAAPPALAKNFALKGKIGLTKEAIRLDAAMGELGGSALTGDLRYGFAKGGALKLALESERLDLSDLVSGDLSLGELVPGKAQTPDVASSGLTIQAMIARIRALDEAAIRIKAGIVSFANQEAQDVYADFATGGDSLNIGALQFVTSDGLRMTASGKLQSLTAAAEGDIKFSVEVANADGVQSLGRIAGLKQFAEASEERAAMLSPLRIAGSLKARGSAAALDFKLDGLASDSPFSLEGRLEGENGSVWRGGLTIDAWMSNADGGKLLAQILPGAEAAVKTAAPQQGILNIAASGQLDGALNGKISVRTSALAGSFGGQMLLTKSPWEASGDLKLKSADAASSTMISSLLFGRSVISEPFSVEASAAKTENRYTLSGMSLNVGGIAVTGGADVDVIDGAPSISASVEADRASAPGLFALLLDNASKSPAAAISLPGENVWPDAPFSSAFFEDGRHSLSLKSKTLNLGAGLVLERAELAASLDRGALVVTKLEGDVAGGKFSGQGLLKRERGRFSLSGRAGLSEARLEALFGSGDPSPLASGAVTMDARFTGQGASPHGVVSNLSGKGSLRFGQGVLYKFSPAAPERLARELGERVAPPKAAVEKSLVAYIRQGDFAYKRLRAPFVIKNGALRVRRASFRGADYLLRSEIETDLAALRFDSEWRLGVRAGRRASETPPVKAVFAGPLAELRGAKLSIETYEFERFLAVRKMERDVESLERLNQYGRLPVEAAPPPSGARIEKRRPPPFASPPSDSSVVERRQLPPLPDSPLPRPEDVRSWKPISESEPDLKVLEKAPGAFEARIRSAIGSPASPAVAPRAQQPDDKRP